MASNRASSPLLIKSLVHHLVLPPKLPGKQEANLGDVERALSDRLLIASRNLTKSTSGVLSQQWDHTRFVLQVFKDLNAGGKLNKTSLLAEFRALAPRGLLILNIAAQNAGMTIRRDQRQVNLCVFSYTFFADQSSHSERELIPSYSRLLRHHPSQRKSWNPRVPFIGTFRTHPWL